MLGQIRAPRRGFVDHPGDGGKLRVFLDRIGQNFDGPRDHRQDIVEVMGDAAGELADGFHLFGLPNPVLRRDLVGQVAYESIEHDSVAAPQRGDAQLDPDLSSVASRRVGLETAPADLVLSVAQEARHA